MQGGRASRSPHPPFFTPHKALNSTGGHFALITSSPVRPLLQLHADPRGAHVRLEQHSWVPGKETEELGGGGDCAPLALEAMTPILASAKGTKLRPQVPPALHGKEPGHGLPAPQCIGPIQAPVPKAYSPCHRGPCRAGHAGKKPQGSSSSYQGPCILQLGGAGRGHCPAPVTCQVPGTLHSGAREQHAAPLDSLCQGVKMGAKRPRDADLRVAKCSQRTDNLTAHTPLPAQPPQAMKGARGNLPSPPHTSLCKPALHGG